MRRRSAARVDELRSRRGLFLFSFPLLCFMSKFESHELEFICHFFWWEVQSIGGALGASDSKQVTRGHNIVAYGWAEAANPHSHPTPYPTPFPTQTHKASKTVVFTLFDSCSRTNRPTEQRIDGPTVGRTRPPIEWRVRN